MDEKTVWVELLGVTLSGADRPDAGLIWSNLEGWWGLPDARAEGDPIPGGHGRYRRKEILRSSRVITLTGYIHTAGSSDLHSVRDRIEAAWGGGAGLMRVATAGGTWERYVEIDTLKVDPDHGRAWTRFVVDMVAPDPRRYGQLRTLGPVGLPRVTGGVRLPQAMPWNFGTIQGEDRMIVPNGGGIPVSPVFRLTGSGFSELSIIDTTAGRRIALTWPVSGGEPVVIDSARRRVVWGQADLTRWLTYRQWFEIPARETHEFRFEVAGATGDPQLWAEFQEGAW